MAKFKNVNNRATLRYQLQKEFDRFDRHMQKVENAALQEQYKNADEGDISNEALAKEIKKFKDTLQTENKHLSRKQIATKINDIRKEFEDKRKPIEAKFKEDYEEKLKSLRHMVKTSASNYKVLNDELDPGVTLVGHARKQKTPLVADNPELKEFHKSLENNFFTRVVNAFDVVTGKEQSATNKLISDLKVEQMNYSNIKAKNVNQSPSSMIKAYENVTGENGKGKVVGYDLETIGGKDANGIWKPSAITEYSFQTYDINTNKVISNNTAVMGISEIEATKLYNDILDSIEKGTLESNNDLWVTANRMMKYGHDNTVFEQGADGIFTVKSFVDEDAVSNVFDKDQLWKGFKKHIDVYNKANTVHGMKDYEYNFLKAVADIKKQDLTLMGFNDAFFDSPIMDSQMNMIVDKYRDSKEAISAISNLFGGIENVSFNPNKDRRLDFRAAVNLAVDKKGYGAVYGKGYNDFLNEKALKSNMVVRQEYLVERHFSEAFNSGNAHLAIEDVRNLLRLGFEQSEVLGQDETLLGNLMGIIKNEYTPDKVTSLTGGEEGVQKILFSKRRSQAVNYTGRGVLGFTVDNTNGAYKTGAGFMVGNASDAMGDVSRHNITIGGHVSQNSFYSFGGIRKMTMTDDFIKEANKHMPEYARREMYVVKLDKLAGEGKAGHDFASSTYMFFNELGEAEGQVSSMFSYLGDYEANSSLSYEDGDTVKHTKGSFTLNKAMTNEVQDILSGVTIDDNGNILTTPIPKNADGEIDAAKITKALEDAIETSGIRHITDKARRYATDNVYKTSKRYAKLIEAMNKDEELKKYTSNANDVKNYLLGVANKLSSDVSRNEILNGKDRDSLVIAALGYVPKGADSSQKYLYGSTLYNFIEAGDVFHARHEGTGNLFNFIAGKTGVKKGYTSAFDNFNDDDSNKYLTTTNKFEAMYDYLLNKAASTVYEDDPTLMKKAINLAGSETGVSKHELKSYFEFDVAGLGKEDQYLQKTINNVDNANVLRINLKSGDEYNLIDKVVDLYYGKYANTDQDGQVKRAYAMKEFIKDISSSNKDLFKNKELAYLLEDIEKGANGGTISPQVMANRLIRGLNQVKEKDFTAGIIKKDFNIAKLGATDDVVLAKLDEYLNSKEMLEEAYNKTTLFKNIHENDEAAIQDVVDSYFMPTFKGKTGQEALDLIASQDIYTKDQAKVLRLNWQKAKETHTEYLTKFFGLITQGGGKIHVSNSGVNIEMSNGEMLNFDGLTKTRYDNGTLYHQVKNSKVTAQLDLGWDNGQKDFNIQSNLKEVFSKSFANYNMEKINREIDSGEFTIDTLKLFVGRVQGSALEEAVISDFNLHERNSQFRIGLGDSIGKNLKELVGTKEASGRWVKAKTIDGNIIDRIRKIVNNDNWDTGRKEITPELKELLIKNIVPILEQTTSSDEVKEILELVSFSNKDSQIAKASTDAHLGERYSQQYSDRFDNAQRPVTAAQKKIFKKGELEENIAKYIKATGGTKDVYTGAIIDEASTDAMKRLSGIAIDGVEQSITFGKANVGQVALMAIVDNNFNKVLAENNTVAQLTKEQKELQFHLMKRKMNVFEQEKVMDARLMDAVFEMGANKQFVSTNKDVMGWIQNIDPRKTKDVELAHRLSNVKSSISFEDGVLEYSSKDGEIVDRGEAILKYIGFGDKETQEHSKQFMGRLKYGVFEKKGELKLSDEQVTKFLQENISEIERLADTLVGTHMNKNEAMEKASNEVLSKYFKTGFYVEDIRQKTYMKVMNEGVEKDMTNGLYVGLGQLDSRIAQYMEKATYQKGKETRNLKDFAGQVLTLSEIDIMFGKNFNEEAAKSVGFKTAKELRNAIEAERYYDSVSVFDLMDEFKKSSMITSHAVAKHNNSGMIFSNTLGSILNIYKREADGDHIKALARLRDNLVNNDIIDMFDDNGNRKKADEVLEITKDGRMLHHTFKSNKSDMTNDLLKTVETLNVENLMNMIRADESLRGELMHEDAKIYDPTSSSGYKTATVFGDVIRTNLKDSAGNILKNIVVGTKAQSGSEVAIDGEFMTVYDYSTVKALEEKARVDRDIVRNKIALNNLQTQKNNAIALGKDTSKIDESIERLELNNELLKYEKSMAAENLGEMTSISKGKKVGNQEFGIYNLHILNKNSADSVTEFMQNNIGGIDDKVLSSLKSSFSGVLIENSEGSYELSKELEGYRVLGDYMKNIKSRNLFKTTGEDTGLELELRKEMLELDEYKHLKNTYEKVRAVADEHIGPDAKISVRYAEEAHQIESAHLAYKYNKRDKHSNRKGLISDDTLREFGFEDININELITSGAEADSLGLNSMFNTNYLVDLDEFGTIALPKAGKITGDDTIKAKFQNTLMGIQQAIDEYKDLHTTKDSEEAVKTREKIQGRIDTFVDKLRESIYDKEGMLYHSGKTELEDSFRVKSSTATVLNSDIAGEGSEEVQKSLDVISSKTKEGKALLDKARINGVSISQLEDNGIYHDYMFVSSDVFKNLGYFEEEKMARYLRTDINDIKADPEKYKAQMKEMLETHGDIFMGERYPAIWRGSDKPMRVFLDDSITDINRARLSLATMLSMNGDNDGDSISASLLRSSKGVNYLQYKMEKEKFIKDNNMQDVNSDEAIAMIDKHMDEAFNDGSSRFFKAVEANMALESVTANRHFAEKGMKDMIDELQTAVANGDLNSIKAVKFNSLYGGKLYANYGGTSSMEALATNELNVNNMIQKANEINDYLGGMFTIKSGATRVNDAGDYVTHLNDNFKVFDAMQNPNVYKELSTEDKARLKEAEKHFEIDDKYINTAREDAIMRARWMDYQSETMAKARKGSIGPINVALQQHRQGVNEIYDSSNAIDHAKKIAVQHISKEIEQEVISSKHGNVIFNMTKTTDLIDTYRNIWNHGMDHRMEITDMSGKTSSVTTRESLVSWMNTNLEDKKIKSIVTEIQANTSESYMKDTFGITASQITDDNIGTVRGKLGSIYADALNEVRSSEYGKNIRRLSRQGGNMVDDISVVAVDRALGTTDIMNNILTFGEDKISRPTRTSTNYGTLNTAMFSSSEKAVSAMTSAIDSLSNVQVKGMSGIAIGALGVAAGMLVSGFAGGPVDQTSASDYAQQEENNKPQAMSVPTMMDNGGFATTSNTGGYIINIRANSNKDMTQTKKVLRQAASASVGGGVNVNMNIKERSERLTERDIESMIAGIF